MDVHHFLDKRRGKNFDIEEFPFLFTMQFNQGVCGMVLSGFWFVILAMYYPDFWNRVTITAAGAVIAGFLAITALSPNFSQVINDRKLNGRLPSDLDYYARRSMLILVLLFCATCSILIWLTGGASSPFIPFYVMVYTLILTRCAAPHPGRALWFSYTAAFIAAGVLAWWLLPMAADPSTVLSIRTGMAKEGVDFVFAILSMAVPYWSTVFAEHRERRRALANGESLSSQATASPSDTRSQ